MWQKWIVSSVCRGQMTCFVPLRYHLHCSEMKFTDTVLSKHLWRFRKLSLSRKKSSATNLSHFPFSKYIQRKLFCCWTCNLNSAYIRHMSNQRESYFDEDLWYKYMENIEKQYADFKEKGITNLKENEVQKLSLLASTFSKYKANQQYLGELNSMISENRENQEMIEMTKEELLKCEEDILDLKEQIIEMMVPDEVTYNDIEIQINSAVGGQESMLFACEIYSMYMDLASNNGWTCETVDIASADLKGSLRHATLRMSADNIYNVMKYEGGVHRVQRVPKTEKGSRIHTSTVTVFVAPVPEEIEEQEIDPKDLKIETMHASGAGGQHVNKTESAVRVTHIPTGLKAECQEERSQHANREKCMKKLKEKLFQAEFEKQLADIQKNRKIQVGSSSRTEKIRTYNFPQDRVTDHRIHYTTHNIDSFLSGGEPLQYMMEELDKRARYEAVNELLRTWKDNPFSRI